MLPRDIAWLHQWEPLQAPGKHSSVSPAVVAYGYQYNGVNGNAIWAYPHPAPVMPRTEPTWVKSPQVRFWLEPEKKSLCVRLLAWLRGAA